MTRRGLIRSALKWIGAASTVLLLFIWVGSATYVCSYGSRRTYVVACARGMFWLQWESQPPSSEIRTWTIRRGSQPCTWWFYFDRSSASTQLGIPVWLLALMTGVPTVLSWRRDRRRRLDPSACPKCGYSRSGLPPDRACPECGG